MAAVIGGISVFLEDDSARFQNSMRRNAALVEQQSQRMTRSLAGTAKTVDDLNRKASQFQPDAFKALAISALRAQTSIERLRTSLFAVVALAGGGFGGAFGAKALTDAADQYTNINNRIKAVVEGSRERVAVEREIYEIAQRTRTTFESNAQLFQRLANSRDVVKATNAEMLRMTEITQKAIVAGGATTSEAASTATQLSQALGAGRLQGDELRSLLENAPLLVSAIAKEFGVARGELKQMGADGKLVSDRVFRAILNAGQEIDKTFQQISPTVSGALTVLDNAFTRYIGGADQSLGASAALANGIMSLANNLDTLGDTLLYVSPLLAGFFAARGLTRLGGAVADPIRAAAAARQAAVAEAKAAEQAAAERFVNSSAAVAQTRTRARTDLDSFADSSYLRDRRVIASEIEAANRDLEVAEDRYRKIASKFDQVDQQIAGRDLERVAKGTQFTAFRKEIREASKEITQAEAELARLADPKASVNQVRIQEKITAGLEKEEELRRRIHNVQFQERQRLPENVTDPSQMRVTTFTHQRETLERQLKRAIEDRGKLEASLNAEIAARQEKNIAATERLAAARQKLVAAERALSVELQRTTAQQTQQRLTGITAELAPADAARQSALERLKMAEALKSENETLLRQSALANATNATAAAQRRAAIDAASLTQAQTAVARAVEQSTLRQMALSSALNGLRAGFSGLIGFLGGPWGAAITAATAAWGIYEIAQARAAARTEENKKALDGLAESMEKVRQAQARSEQLAGPDLIAVRAQAMGAQASIDDQLRSIRGQLEGGTFEFLTNELAPVRRAFNETGMSLEAWNRLLRASEGDSQRAATVLEQFRETLLRVGAANPDLSPTVNELLRVVGAAIEGAKALNAFNAARAQLGAVDRTPIAEAMDIAADERRMKRFQDTINADIERQGSLGPSVDTLIRNASEQIRQDKVIQERIRDAEIEHRKDRAAKVQAAVESLREQFPNVDEATLRRLAELETKEFKTPKARKDPAAAEAEKFADRLERIIEESRAGFFTDIDRQVVEELKKIKGDPALMRQTVDAMLAGQPLPAQAQQLKDAMIAREAGREYQGLVQQYGTGAQLSAQFAERQAILNSLVAQGKITADQAQVAYADYVTSFGQFQYIDDIANAFEGFGHTMADALFEGKNGMEALANAGRALAKELFNIGIQIALLEPLKNLLRGGMTAGAGGFNPFSWISSLFTGAAVNHSGGGANKPASRSIPSWMVGSAPRFHNGLRANELVSVLERDEVVLNRKQQARAMGLVNGLASMAGGGDGMKVEVINQNGSQIQVEKKQNNGRMTARVLVKNMLMDDLSNNGELAQMMQDMYGLNRMNGRT